MDLNKPLLKYAVYYPIVWLRLQNVPFYYQQLMKSQYDGKDTLNSIQQEKLQCLLRQAVKHVPYYKKKRHLYEGVLKKGRVCLQALPLLSKAEIQLDSKQFVSDRTLPLFTTRKTTGGSTGQPLTLYKSNKAMARELAATWRGYSWCGVGIGDRQARFWGVPSGKTSYYKAQLTDFITNRKRCSAFSFTDDDLLRFTERMFRFRPVYFYGYVSMLESYAAFIRRNNIRLPFNLRCIITTSEVLSKPQKKLIEDTFRTRVYNEYGCGELGSVAHECEHGSMHVMAENMIVEIVNNDGKPARPGEVGEIVVTELNNTAMPLIRYRTGDFASFQEKPCPCGRCLPVIEKLYGRAYDMIENKEGKKFHGEFIMYIMEDAKRQNLGIEHFQARQMDYDAFEFHIVSSEGYGKKTEEFITARIRKDYDPAARVIFKLVDSIKRSPSGKMRLIVGMDRT